ncbi:MAG: 30S ribosomal protein S6 [Candidatus Pacebacteria bacterium]|nr:30S ribosomal protein S6 [Candidatus Paceibacterota bacterium]
MKYYDYTYLTRQDMSEEDAKKLSDKLAASITAKNGVIADQPKAYKKRLAYRIKKQENAYVNTILFQAEAAAIEEFKKETDGVAEILRGLVIVYDPEKLKREIRPEYAEKTTEAETATTKTEAPAAEAVTKKKEEVKEIKKEKEEKVEAKAKEEPKEAKEEKEKPAKAEEKKEEAEEEAKEERPKPKRRAKIKTELKDIEQKLDEILK